MGVSETYRRLVLCIIVRLESGVEMKVAQDRLQRFHQTWLLSSWKTACRTSLLNNYINN
jgi:hypothetical protein